MSLVLVGHKQSSNSHKEARSSWSTSEIILISSLPQLVKQGFIAAKYTFKSLMNIQRDQNENTDGRSYVGSFHLKTTFLHYLEKNPPSKIRSPFGLMIALFAEMANHLNLGQLPHYFLPDCNLLDTVGPGERQTAIHAIQTILSDPIAAVINCPLAPREIYGDICPLDLVSAFCHVSTHPSCGRSRKDLVLLLSSLDEWRGQCYQRLVDQDHDEDKDLRVSGRPELRGLVDMLQQRQHCKHISIFICLFLFLSLFICVIAYLVSLSSS